MNKFKTILQLVLPALIVGFLLARCGSIFPEHSIHQHDASEAAGANVVWTCSMHPQFQFPEQTPCPICGMDLIPIDPASAGLGERQMAMSDEALALAEISTTEVVSGQVSRELHMVGVLNWDETKLSSITAWAGGRIDQLHLTVTGERVSKGESIAEIWSPEINSAVGEFTEAISAAEQMNDAPGSILLKSSEASIVAAEEKLFQLGLSKEKIAAIKKGEPATGHISFSSKHEGIVIERMAAEGDWVKKGQTLYCLADPSQLWVQLKAHENDLPWLALKQSVSLHTEALPGNHFMGEISFISPTLDPKTRTVDVRVTVDNKNDELKPGMFVRAVVNADLGHKPKLIIPHTAPLVTGKRAVVYVQLPDPEKHLFEGREVLLGQRAGDSYVVLEGLAEGEIVVTNGAFKIDSALQIQAKPSMMSIGADGSSQQLEVPLTFKEHIGDLATPYLELRIALAADEFEMAQEQVKLFAKKLGEIDPSILSEGVRDRWEPLFARMNNGANEMLVAKGIEELRVGFDRASKGIIQVTEDFGYSRSGDELKVFYCSMAFNDTGAKWLQVKDRLANPYFGASMLRCGEMLRVLPVTEESK